MLAFAGGIILTSLLGSPHCGAMCGPLVCLYSGGNDPRRTWPAHTAYHVARGSGYVLLGVLAGWIGAGVDGFAAWAGITRGAAIVAGTLMVLWGAATIANSLGIRRRGPGGTGRTTHILAALRSTSGRPPVVRAATLGALTAALPCGWLWVYVAAAGATGSPLRGAVLMGLFWIGTVPMLVGIAVLAQRALGPLRRALPVATAVALVIIGLLTIAGRFTLPTMPGHAGH